jgi:hypothetical protein
MVDQSVAKTRFPGGVCKNMRLRMNDSRERRLEALVKATGEATKSKAIDTAAAYYTRMAGGTEAVPRGQLAELMELAEEQGSVTPAEIADVLDTRELPVEFESKWSVGD